MEGRACLSRTFHVADLEGTEKFASLVAQVLYEGQAVFLYGDLGAGKTTFVKFVTRALGYGGAKSPSFTLVNVYDRARIPVVHADLYRLERADGRDFDLDEYLLDGFVLFVEWPERLASFISEDYWKVCIGTLESDSDARNVVIEAYGDRSLKALEGLLEMIGDEF